MKMIDYLCKRLEYVFAPFWRKSSSVYWGEREERKEFNRKSLKSLTFEDALHFAEALEKQVAVFSKDIANERCANLGAQVSGLSGEVQKMREELDFIQTEAFIDGVVERIKSKQL